VRSLALLLLVAAAIAEDEASLLERFLRCEEEAFAHYRAKEWDEAVAAFERQIAVYADNPRPYYNIACCHALKGDAERAATWLRVTIARGWRDREHLAKDPDFDAVREADAFRACVAELENACALDPDAMPRRLPPASAMPASSANRILAAAAEQEELLRAVEGLLGEHEFRRRLFDSCDRHMAALTRYLAENGDARDADAAARGRVRIAMLYLERAKGDDALRTAASAYVIATAEEFVRGWAGSPHLPEVLLWRAQAARAQGEEPERVERVLRSVLADHPGSRADALVRIELCDLLAAAGPGAALDAAFRDLEARWGRRAVLSPRLAAARLLVEGLPDSVSPRDGLRLYLFVSVRTGESEQRLAALRERKPVVVCVDGDEAEVAAWLAAHAAGLDAAAAPDLPPALVIARDGRVLAVDPADEQLDALLAERS
jgi:hypothetical protein